MDGRQYGYFNNNSDVEQTIIAPTNGRSIETTLDIGAQQIVEKWVNAFQEAMGGANVGVIVEDPNTGGIIAMDGGDRYDLNEPRDMSRVYSQEEIKAMNDAETVDALNAMWRNYCTTDAYEPGSTVKPVVMAGGLWKRQDRFRGHLYLRWLPVVCGDADQMCGLPQRAWNTDTF